MVMGFICDTVKFIKKDVRNQLIENFNKGSVSEFDFNNKDFVNSVIELCVQKSKIKIDDKYKLFKNDEILNQVVLMKELEGKYSKLKAIMQVEEVSCQNIYQNFFIKQCIKHININSFFRYIFESNADFNQHQSLIKQFLIKFNKCNTVYLKTIDEIIEGAYCPLNIDIIPNIMGINLCSVANVSWVKQPDGQVVKLTINFIPTK